MRIRISAIVKDDGCAAELADALLQAIALMADHAWFGDGHGPEAETIPTDAACFGLHVAAFQPFIDLF
jgi:hypothetical protein